MEQNFTSTQEHLENLFEKNHKKIFSKQTPIWLLINQDLIIKKTGTIKKNVQLRHLFEDIFDDITNEEYQLLNLDELYWMWSRGVAYHHAGLAPIVKEFVEFLFINKHISYE